MTILEDAAEAVKDRQATYGHPADHWRLTTALVNARFGTNFKAEDWGIVMVLEKVAREAKSHVRDNSVDIAGYAAAREMVLERQGDAE